MYKSVLKHLCVFLLSLAFICYMPSTYANGEGCISPVANACNVNECEECCVTECEPCASSCGYYCGVSYCTIGLGIAAVAAVAAFILASGTNDHTSH